MQPRRGLLCFGLMNQQPSSSGVQKTLMGQYNQPSSFVAGSRDIVQLLYPWLVWEQLLSQERSCADSAHEDILARARQVSDV